MEVMDNMFDIENIRFDKISRHFKCFCKCVSVKAVEEISANYLMFVRKINMVMEIYSKEDVIIIGGPSKAEIIYAANEINKDCFFPHVNVTIFWGTNSKGDDPRWCIGIDSGRNNPQIISSLNTYGNLLSTVKQPQYWSDVNNHKYSVVMLTACFKDNIDHKELFTHVQSHLQAIEKVVNRRIDLSILNKERNPK